jgi:hypothetical protein
MNKKDSNLLAEAYQQVLKEESRYSYYNPSHAKYLKPNPEEKSSEETVLNSPEPGNKMPATHGEQGYNEEEITYDQLVAYNNDYDIEDVFDMIYKGVNSGQISYDTYTKFMRTVIE